MFRLIGLIVGFLLGLFLTRSFFLEGLLMGGLSGASDFAMGGIAVSGIAALAGGLGGYIIGGIIDATTKKKPKDN